MATRNCVYYVGQDSFDGDWGNETYFVMEDELLLVESFEPEVEICMECGVSKQPRAAKGY